MKKIAVLVAIIILISMTASAARFSGVSVGGAGKPQLRGELPGQARRPMGEYGAPATCTTGETKCAGRVFRTCLNGRFVMEKSTSERIAEKRIKATDGRKRVIVKEHISLQEGPLA